MPLPKTKSIGKVIEFLKKEKPDMSKKQRIAVALSHTKKDSKKDKAVIGMAKKIHESQT